MIDALIKGIRPTRTFVKLSRPLINIGEARAVFRVLADYGEMVEYKIMRVKRVANTAELDLCQ